MNFTDFIAQNHPDPDSLLNPKYDQFCKLAEDYAKSLQLLQSCVSVPLPLTLKSVDELKTGDVFYGKAE